MSRTKPGEDPMADPRLEKWAEILVHYSLQAKTGERILINSDIGAMPLVEACYECAVRTGLKVECLFHHDRLQEILLREGTEEQLRTTPELKYHAVKEFDLFIFIYGPSNLTAATKFPLERQVMVAQANQPILHTTLNRKADGEIRWVRTDYPTAASAQLASMATTEFEEFVIRAGFLDHPDPIASWTKLGEAHQRLIDFLADKKELRFTSSNGTDLSVNIEGMSWVNLCGTINFPDGEIYTGPNLDAEDGGVNGFVRYDFPTVYKGVEVRDIAITFEEGAVKEATASYNEAFLHSMIEQDAGAKFVGEVAIGTNYAVTEGVKNILFDEKIGGTFHTALGMGYPQTGNTNESALHWDLVCDLRKDGVIWADGEKILEAGRFLRNDWPQPFG